MKISALFAALLALPAFAGTHTVVYEVPAPAELAPYSSFELTYESRLLPDGQTEISYKLPLTLVGTEQEFRFQGSSYAGADAFTFKGEKGEMACATEAGATKCRVSHRDVTIDVDAVVAKLETLNLSPEEKAGRARFASFVAMAARADGGDMVGILHYLPDFLSSSAAK